MDFLEELISYDIQELPDMLRPFQLLHQLYLVEKDAERYFYGSRCLY